MYKIKAKYLGMVLKYSMKTGIDITGVYDKATWNKNGFKDIILEEVQKQSGGGIGYNPVLTTNQQN